MKTSKRINLELLKEQLKREKPEINKELYEKKKQEFIKKLPQVGFQNRHRSIFSATVGLLSHFWVSSMPKGLLLLGGVGTGKTTAMQIICAYFNKYNKAKKTGEAFFITATQLVRDCKADDVKFWEWMKRMNKCHLFIDDLGTEPLLNDYGNKQELLTEIIAYRYNLSKESPHLVTCFTTNLDKKKLIESYSQRSYSRLSEMCVIVIADGEDLRGKNKIVINNNKKEA